MVMGVARIIETGRDGQPHAVSCGMRRPAAGEPGGPRFAWAVGYRGWGRFAGDDVESGMMNRASFTPVLNATRLSANVIAG